MDTLNIMSHLFLSAGNKVTGRRFEIVARKMIVGDFRAPRIVSWGGIDHPATAEVWIRHDKQAVRSNFRVVFLV